MLRSKSLWQVTKIQEKLNHKNQWKLLNDNSLSLHDSFKIENHFHNVFATVAQRTLQASNISTHINSQGISTTTNDQFQLQPATQSKSKKP